MSSAFPVMIDFTPPSRQGYAEGGLAKKAQDVRKGADNGDVVLIHVNPEEYELIKQKFGPPRINPDTGLPQFGWFSDLTKNIPSWVAPVAMLAANVFLPGVGAAIGAGLSGALGLGLSETAAAALGSGVMGAGIGGITGGTKGALIGGTLGAITPYALGPSGLGLTGQGGALSGLNLGDTAGAVGTNPNLYSSPIGPTSTGDALSNFSVGPSLSGGVTGGSGAPTSGLLSSLSGGISGSTLLKAAPLLLGAASLAGGSPKQATPVSATSPDKNFTTHLSDVPFNRTRNENVNVGTRYGMGPEQEFFNNNQIDSLAPKVVTASSGRYVRGGGTGVSDSIPARLSDGEYVIDAQTVSMIGDGSSDAGAKKLDALREQIRRQKGSALAKGKFAPNAKSPLSYLKGV